MRRREVLIEVAPQPPRASQPAPAWRGRLVSGLVVIWPGAAVLAICAVVAWLLTWAWG